MKSQNAKAPTAPVERIVMIDALRGLGVLGILVMNIQSYAMVGAAYINPTAYGDFTGVNRLVWILSHILADQKFISIFSILFGAGIVLITSKLETKGQKALGIHYRRNFWLLVLGLAHAYLIWFGDILVAYALCGFVVVFFRKMKPVKLLIIGLIVFSVSSVIYVLIEWAISNAPPEIQEENRTMWMPSDEETQQELAAYQGGWLDQMPERVSTAVMMQTLVFCLFTGWRAGGLMLVGMALFKWGVLSGERSMRFYRRLAALGIFAGIPLILGGLVYNYANEWAFIGSMFFGSQFNYWGSLFMALGYIGLAVWIFRAWTMARLRSVLAAVGRMAFTNYLMQSLICTWIFYGHGLGLFGRVERYQQALIMAGIWVFQIIFSLIWLRYFKFGPAEWLWRALTYFKAPAMRR